MNQKHWNDFWNQGFITTFGETLPTNYTGNLRNFWEEVFLSLENHCKILDVATGNGAIASIAADKISRSNKDVSIYAADAAVISESVKQLPLKTKELRKSINFFSNTPCESLPFSQEHFDLVTSQFGIEYSDWNLSLKEIFRVLKTGASAHFVCHHEKSSIVAPSMSEASIYESAMKKYRIFDAAIGFIQIIATTGCPTNQQASTQLNKTINDFRLEFSGNQLCSSLIAEIAEPMKRLRAIGTERVLTQLKSRKAEFESAHARLLDMKNAALNDTDIKNVLAKSREIGFSSADSLNFNNQLGLIGIHLHLVK
ncbi:class I SAM-dependent methyltransferase [Microbulbifer rhizosphaerae]|uniref:Ubiquinone/menaquinone biosynthesis C-methylase UbiE n=1 Tax=Microbulbifer rhizosphaerae TaxID=1562603 RepID=A0A7W4WCZ5_9GAMM|nr:class I SAM-dependent methyltransferase [Microbulbifer rhizosphaerae]MBB3061969.1 ubiquinone/menaquinone biosynthesis C-methylase UbiE [Microbulbifer rhizosphaerae]